MFDSCETRKDDIGKILLENRTNIESSSENSPVPITEEGVIHGGNKSAFMHKLEELLPQHLQNIEDVQGCDAVIHDGHAVVRTMQEPAGTDKSFQDISSRFQAKILTITRFSTAQEMGSVLGLWTKSPEFQIQ